MKMKNIMCALFLTLAFVLLSTPAVWGAEDSCVVGARNQDPGCGALINAGNAYLEIEIYRHDARFRRGFDGVIEGTKVAEFTMRPAMYGLTPELRGNTIVTVEREWLRLEPGSYTFAVYPTRGLGIFKRQLPRRTFDLTINDDPTDYVYNGRYVGWTLRLDVFEPDIAPSFQYRIN